MKKIYAFFAAALISLSAFASIDVVPTDAVLADYYNQGDVCVCFFVPADMACNNIVLTGSFNGWSSTVAECVPVEAVEGYDGWYVGSFTPEAEPDATKGIQAKPIMLAEGGTFNWEYQIGAAVAVRGGVQVVAGAYAGEIDLINYGTDAPNVFTVTSWKQNPCTAVYHNYTVTVISDGCNGLVIPFIVGGMNGWTFQQMQIDAAKTQDNQAPTYYITFKAAEGTPYQLVSGGMDPNTGLVDSTAMPGWNDDSYMQKLVEGAWVRIPGEDGDNQLTHEDANILWDLRADTLRWGRCDDSPLVTYTVAAKMPAENCPEAVEIIGGFDSWEGTAMTFNASTGYFEATVEAKAAQFFKFRSAGSWDQELEIYDATLDEWAKIGDNDLVFGQLADDLNAISLDFSTLGRWTVKEGIENIVLTEKAQKVMVDGVLYIVRDNKMFNVQGIQVR